MPQEITVNGQHLVLHGITGNVGDKQGVASISVPIEVPDLVTAFSIEAADVAAAVGLSGLLMCTDRPLQQLEHGGYQVHFQFEGFHQDKSPQQAEALCSYSVHTDMGEAPIQTHPKFLTATTGLAAKYGYKFTEDKFPVDVPGTKGGGNTALSDANVGNPPTNPLFGVESWLRVGMTYTRTFAATSVSATLYQKIGTLVDYPPGAEKLNIPHFKKRKWLKMSPQVETGNKGSGNAIRVTESYRLTGATNGSEAVLYDQGQLDD